MDNLFMTDVYQLLCKHINDGFSALPPVFPNFEDIASSIQAIDVQQLRLQSLHPNATASHQPLNPSPTLSSAPSNSASTAIATACPHPTCTNCKALGHSIEACWEPGGGNVGRCEHFLADCLVHQHANFAGDLLVDHPSAFIPATPPPLTAIVIEPTPNVAHLSVSDDVVESNLFDCYPDLISESQVALPLYLAFLQLMNPFALASFAS